MDYYTYLERGSEGWWPLPEGDQVNAKIDWVEILSAVGSEANDVLPGPGFVGGRGQSSSSLD